MVLGERRGRRAGGRGAHPHALAAPRPRAGRAGARVGQALAHRAPESLRASSASTREGCCFLRVKNKASRASRLGAPGAAGFCFTQNDQRELEGEKGSR